MKVEELLSAQDLRRLQHADPPWLLLGPEERPRFEDELAGEIQEGHILYGLKVVLLARRGRSDGFLGYVFEGGASPWFHVHLTWSFARYRTPEQLPWPSARRYPTVEDLLKDFETPEDGVDI